MGTTRGLAEYMQFLKDNPRERRTLPAPLLLMFSLWYESDGVTSPDDLEEDMHRAYLAWVGENGAPTRAKLDRFWGSTRPPGVVSWLYDGDGRARIMHNIEEAEMRQVVLHLMDNPGERHNLPAPYVLMLSLWYESVDLRGAAKDEAMHWAYLAWSQEHGEPTHEALDEAWGK